LAAFTERVAQPVIEAVVCICAEVVEGAVSTNAVVVKGAERVINAGHLELALPSRVADVTIAARAASTTATIVAAVQAIAGRHARSDTYRNTHAILALAALAVGITDAVVLAVRRVGTESIVAALGAHAVVSNRARAVDRTCDFELTLATRVANVASGAETASAAAAIPAAVLAIADRHTRGRAHWERRTVRTLATLVERIADAVILAVRGVRAEGVSAALPANAVVGHRARAVDFARHVELA